MPHRLTTLLPILLLASVVFACALEGQGTAQGRDKGGKPIQVRGILTGEGVECQALRSANGQLYTLTGELGAFKTGDKVHVKGEIAQVSTCQQGITIAVEKIEEDKSEGKDPIEVTGKLTDEGVECPALRGDDGQLYTLTPRDLQGFKPGDRVTVTGKVAERSFCQQGTTIEVRKIKAAK